MNRLTYTDLMDTYIQLAYDEFKQDDSRELIDIVHEIADSSKYVIYHNAAWDLVSFVRLRDSDEYFDAQDIIEDTGEETADLDALMTKTAYWIIFNVVRGCVLERLEAEEEAAE